MNISVPYQSQYYDISEPHRAAGACGMACMTMLSGYYMGQMPLLDSVDSRGRAEGGYTVSGGWLHSYMQEAAPIYGFHLEKIEIDDTDFLKYLTEEIHAGRPFIASVFRQIFERKLYHMILIVGYEEIDNVMYVVYHEPASTQRDGGAYKKTSLEDFCAYFRGVLFLSRK